MAATLLERGIKPDDRMRLALGKILKRYEAGTVFDCYTDGDRIILEPQVLIPAREAWVFKNPKALAAVKRGLSQLGKKPGKARGSFAKGSGINA